MSKHLLTVVLLLAIFGLLVIQRFSLPRELPVRIAAGAGEEAGYGFGEDLRRGSIIDTKDGFLELTIGVELEDLQSAQIHVWMSRNTRIELVRLFEDELILKLHRGRILVSNQSIVPLMVKTNFTSSVLMDDLVSLVNYDFLETIHVMPIEGSVVVQTQASDEAKLSPVALSIHETTPVTVETIEINLESGSDWDFYSWTEQIQRN